jgi:hypothetical protein
VLLIEWTRTVLLAAQGLQNLQIAQALSFDHITVTR